MTMTETSIEELQAAATAARTALEAAETAAREEAARRAHVIAEAQALRYSETLANGKALDEALASEYRAHHEAALDAIAAGDLLEAFKEFTAYKSLGVARYLARTELHTAANALGSTPYTTADYTDRSREWDELLARAIEEAAAKNGKARIEAEIPPAATEYDDAVAIIEGMPTA